MKEKLDRDLLIEINTILKELKIDFNNHLRTHSKYTYLAVATALSAIVSLVMIIIKSYF